ncbi:hypothetical protein GA0074695_6147 [Micromonospora viridifaciens]|uniref:Uncharacterized protein n=1 Tax=Micromonospora viridifaciens TaxID=1881 RepID=A0A1C4ZUE1_MICVI|nr:hypothetical protein [Micromonospora viridifaciens]SCF36637.1 hypothetical protein GA0074695_6147 [Micromonospora viridifaciens]
MERSHTGPDAARIALAWLGHPVTVFALVVLVLNDHVLKAAQPGWLTGKLSDVAGLVLAPPLVAVLAALIVPRLPARAAAGLGLGLVGVGFTVVKTSGYAAAAASAAWSVVSGPSLVRADRTDLLALPALAVAGWCWGRARRDPVGRRSARLVRLLVLLPAAVLAVAATTAVRYHDAVRTAVVDGRLAAGVGSSQGAYPSPYVDTWRVSDDGGETWRDPTPAEEQLLDPWLKPSSGSAVAPPPAPPAAPKREGCSVATPQRCYRLVAGRIRVDESDDAGQTWRLAWEVTEEQRAILSRRYQEAGPHGERITSQELTVLDVGDGRHVVLVANGRDGFALRGPDGDWRRIGFAGAYPAEDVPPPLGAISPAERRSDPLRAVLLAVALAGLVLIVSGARAGLKVGRGSWLPLLLGAFTFVTALVLAVVWLVDSFFLLSGAVLVCVVLLLGTPWLALIPTWVKDAQGRWIIEVLLGAVLTAMLAGLPLTGWLYGRPAYASTAVALAGLAAVPGLLLGWRAARLVGNFAPRAEPPYPLLPAVAPMPDSSGPVRPVAPDEPAR